MLNLRVNVKDSADWLEQRYQEFCQAYSEGSQAVYDELLSIPRLLKELQKRQLDHMLSQRHRLVGNLTALASKLDVTVCACSSTCKIHSFHWLDNWVGCYELKHLAVFTPP
jgi:hypothetical protein